MQFQTAVEYQRLADRWFKFRVRVTLDPVSALNSWWNSGSSFGLAWMLLFRCFFVLLMYPKSLFCFPCMKSLLLTWLWAKIAIFVGYVRSYPRKSVWFRQKYPRKSVITYWNANYFSSSTYHIINRNSYICLLYDMLIDFSVWQRIQWGPSCPENWNRRCRLWVSKSN